MVGTKQLTAWVERSRRRDRGEGREGREKRVTSRRMGREGERRGKGGREEGKGELMVMTCRCMCACTG